jgi:uroporphyrinogen decarboxylase
VLIREVYKDPEFVHALMRASTDAAKTLVDAYVKRGGVPVCVEPVGTGSMVSDKHFREFIMPYLKEIIERIQSHGLPGVLHICGRTRRIIQSMVETGAQVLSVDDIDMAEAKRLVGDKVCLMGNVSPADGMLKGNPEIIEAMVRDCVAKAADNPRGFILATGCEVPLLSPPENITAFVESGRRLTRLPISLN